MRHASLVLVDEIYFVLRKYAAQTQSNLCIMIKNNKNGSVAKLETVRWLPGPAGYSG
jgi:hypothetical protein